MKTGTTYEKNTENKVLAYCKKTAMFDAGDKVVLGVSGGADSICLLFVLHRLQEQLGIELCVVHVNHKIREEAVEDAAYVRMICEALEIPFVLKEVDVQTLAKELHMGTEEAGRKARYQAFDDVAREFGAEKIAVAHSSNDRAETMLFHLFRGTGLKGMAGILPVRDKIVRPLLCLEREQIEAYLEQCGIEYKTDATNETDDYTRNRIRRNILPYVKAHIAEGCIENMCRGADIFAQEEEYLEEQTVLALKVCSEIGSGGENIARICREKGFIDLFVDKFSEYHPVIRKRMLLYVLKHLSPGMQDITATHIDDIMTLFEDRGNRQIHLPYQIKGQRIYGKVRLERGNGESKRPKVFDVQVPKLKEPGDCREVALPDGSRLEFSLLPVDVETVQKSTIFQNISENRYTKWFDYDKIFKWLRVRTRQTGDYLTISGGESLRHKKLKEYMVSEKIPKQEREEIPLIAEEDHVLWVIGHRISEHYKITKNTKRILQVRLVK